MIIVGFTYKTSKFLPRIFCRKFRHVALINPMGTNLIMYQFVRHNKIVKIKLKCRDIKILAQHGWVFIFMPGTLVENFNKYRAFTCVQLAKRALGIRAPYIQTPNALYKYLI